MKDARKTLPINEVGGNAGIAWYAAALDEAEMMGERLGSKFPKERICRSRTSPVIGTHTGPSLLVVTVLRDK